MLSLLTQETLAGVTVVDLTRLLPGPFCTMLLADLGATVIKVEAPRGGDYTRWTPPIVDQAAEVGYGAFFEAINRGKKSLGIDLKKPEGQQALAKLVATADVLIESFRPGVLARLGFSDARLEELNPKLIVASISGYGQDGPYAQRAGHDINYLARGGVMTQTGPRGGAPASSGAQIADVAGGALYCAFGVAAALYQRERTGKGARIDVSMTEGAMSLMGPHMHASHALGKEQGRAEDMLNGGLAGYRCYETSDGRFLSVGALEPKFWMGFCTALGKPDWMARGLQMGADGFAFQEEVEAEIASKPLSHWTAVFAEHDVCVEPVLSFAEVFEDAHFRAREAIVPIDGGGVSAVPPTSPRGVSLGRAPRLGEHTRSVLADAGVDSATIDELLGSGVLREAPAAE